MVRAKRKSLGLSQEKLAERAGCDRQSINRVENAAYSPSLDRVFKLADALGMSLSDLFDEFDRVDSPAVAATGPDRRDAPRSDRELAGSQFDRRVQTSSCRWRYQHTSPRTETDP